MAIHSSTLAEKIPWQATVHGVTESDMTEHTHKRSRHMRDVRVGPQKRLSAKELTTSNCSAGYIS